MADDIASIHIVVPIIFGFFATNRASAVPAPTAIDIILPALRIKNTGRTILLFYYIIYYIILYYYMLFKSFSIIFGWFAMISGNDIFGLAVISAIIF